MASTPAHDARQHVVAYRHYDALGKRGSWPATERKAKMMNKAI